MSVREHDGHAALVCTESFAQQGITSLDTYSNANVRKLERGPERPLMN